MNNLEIAIKKRDEFLKKNPQLVEFQNEIDNALNKCNEKDRSEVLNILIGTTLQNLGDALLEFKKLNVNILNKENQNAS
jgi:hypothetical protein